MVGRDAPEPERSWRAGKTLLARQAHRSENPPASAVGSVNVINKGFQVKLWRIRNVQNLLFAQVKARIRFFYDVHLFENAVL